MLFSYDHKRNLGISNILNTYLANTLVSEPKDLWLFVGFLPTRICMLGVHFNLSEIAILCNIFPDLLDVFVAFFVLDAGPPAKMIQAKNNELLSLLDFYQ